MLIRFGLTGNYWLDPNGGIPNDAFEAFCDFDANSTCLFPSRHQVRRAAAKHDFTMGRGGGGGGGGTGAHLAGEHRGHYSLKMDFPMDLMDRLSSCDQVISELCLRS